MLSNCEIANGNSQLWRCELYSHAKVLNDILSVVTKVLSVCRLWPQPRPCHSNTTGLSSVSDRLLGAVAAPPHHWSLRGWRGRGENPPGHHTSHIPWIVCGTSVTPSVSHPLPTSKLFSGRLSSLCLSNWFPLICLRFGFCESSSSPPQSSCHQPRTSTCASTYCTRLSPNTAASRSWAQRYGWVRFLLQS